jgi:hypothetical protein
LQKQQAMQDEFVISVGQIEELQIINDRTSLDTIFQRAKSTVVCGGNVVLVRKNRSGTADRFESFSTPEDLEAYRKIVYKHVR